MERTRVAVFSKDRWGIGGILTIGSMLFVGSVLLVRWLLTGSLASILIGVVLLIGGVFLFVVKASEEIQVAKRKRGLSLGETGVVVREVGPIPAGVVRISGELWSAESESPIIVGAGIRVVRVNGLHVWVEEVESAS